MSLVIQWLGIDITAKVEPDCPSLALVADSELAQEQARSTGEQQASSSDEEPQTSTEEQPGAGKQPQLSTVGAIATGASTFVVAYAVHKVFAPVRIATTLFATPLIVRWLRAKGVLRAPRPKA